MNLRRSIALAVGLSFLLLVIAIQCMAGGDSGEINVPGRVSGRIKKISSASAGDIPSQWKDRVFLVMNAGKNTCYPNELVPLSIKLFSRDDLPVREIQYPVFAHHGLLVNEFSNPIEGTENRGGSKFNTLEFKTAVYGTRTGDFILGPVRLQCSVPDSPRDALSEYFGARSLKKVTVKSEPAAVKIVPFPSKDKPRDFHRAVGSFDLALRAYPVRLNQWDPISVRVVIKGKGNFETLICPDLVPTGDFRSLGSQTFLRDNMRICEEIITPARDDIKEIPAVAFSFFDVGKKAYRTLRRGPIPIVITNANNKTHPGRTSKPGSVNSGEARGLFNSICRNHLLLLYSLGVVMLVLLVRITAKKRAITDYLYDLASKIHLSRNFARGLKDAKKAFDCGSLPAFYTIVSRILREYFGGLIRVPPADITPGIVEAELRAGGLREDTIEKILRVFRDCDMARYGDWNPGPFQMNEVLGTLKEMTGHLKPLLRRSLTAK